MPERKQLIVRISPQLYEALQRIAADEFRSVNGQIEFILTEYARRRGQSAERTEGEGDGEDL